jgi:AcrR family transcriptional regulator
MNHSSRSVKAQTVGAVVEMRRMPVQARGHRTVARILDAAAALFVEVGYDATTTTEIAKRAAVSIGSLYQFFPDKEAVLEALAVRHIDGVGEILAASQRLGEEASLEDIVALVVERIVAYAREQPFFGVLLVGAGSPPVAHGAERLRRELARRVELIIAYKPISPRRRRVVAAVCVDLLAALLPRTLDDSNRSRAAMLRELKLALGAYLAAVTPSEVVDRLTSEPGT